MQADSFVVDCVGGGVVAIAECHKRLGAPDYRGQETKSPWTGPVLDVGDAPAGGVDVAGRGGAQSVVGDELVAEQLVVVTFGQLSSEPCRPLRLLPVTRRELIEQ